jgi:hypothetical protein
MLRLSRFTTSGPLCPLCWTRRPPTTLVGVLRWPSPFSNSPSSTTSTMTLSVRCLHRGFRWTLWSSRGSTTPSLSSYRTSSVTRWTPLARRGSLSRTSLLGPHFAMYDTTPSYAHLRVFGCACYPNTSAITPHKLSPRSTRCLFLGYSPNHKGYRCLDLVSHRILIYRHIVFDEDVFPLAGSSPPTDIDSLLEFDPIPPPPQIPSLAPLLASREALTLMPPLAP